MSQDMTYCHNPSCPYDDCWRNAKQLVGKTGVWSFSNFSGTCEKYMEYLANKLNGKCE